MGRACSNYEVVERFIMVVVKAEGKGKRPFGRSKFRCKDNIKMGLKEVGWTGMDRIVLAQDRDSWRAVLNAVMNLRFPQNVGKSLTS
jgi:hypothetical protein